MAAARLPPASSEPVPVSTEPGEGLETSPRARTCRLGLALHADNIPVPVKTSSGRFLVAGIGAAPGVDDDEECDVDSRTLAEAAARLAKYTSEEEGVDFPQQQWADLYKESGPEDVTSDVGCDFVALRGSGGAGSGAGGAAGWQLSCGPHKVRKADEADMLLGNG